ncbi:MAG: ATP-binding protein [Sedimentibacter sp.]
MKKRLFLIIMLISIITSAVAFTLSSTIYYEFYVKDAKGQLKTIAEMAADYGNWKDNDSMKLSVNNILEMVDYSLRFTIVEKSGEVIYDNWADYETLESHKDRPEVLGAFERDYGDDTRYSNTISSDMYYYAVKLNDNEVLRLSREINSINAVFASIIPLLAVFFILLLIIGYVTANTFTKKILKPVDEMTKNLDDMLEGEEKADIKIYDEFQPLSYKIKEQKSRINEYISELKYERDTIGIITENMKEGFILINKDKNILSINTSGKRMIRNDKFNLKANRNILELTRNLEIIQNIDNAIRENVHLICDLEVGNNHYRYYFSPVKEKNHIEVTGLLILIEDVTIQKNAEIIRSEFSANVSHELKTPLTTMIGFAEMIKEGLITDMESIKKYCGMINKEGLRLISLIEDIMRLSRIEERIDAEDNSMIDIREIGKEVVCLLKQKAYDNKVKLDFKSESFLIKANKNYMSELLYNLVDNGIKYNKKEGNVSLNIFIEEGYINIVVKDTGVGISEEYQDRIFERFYRVDKSRSKETGGTGLGLSIVKHIAELYGGSIDIKSQENIGTEIIVKFHESSLQQGN